MASSLVFKKLLAQARSFVPITTRVPLAVPTVREPLGVRLITTNSEPHNAIADYSCEGPNAYKLLEYCRGLMLPSTDASCPKTPTIKLSGLLDLLEDNQPSGVWHVKETDEAICILRNMSGKKDVTVTVDKEPSYLANFERWNPFGIVSHKGEIQSFPAVLVFRSLAEEREATISIDLPRERYVTDGIIEIKLDNKLSKVIIPKVKADIIPGFTFNVDVKEK